MGWLEAAEQIRVGALKSTTYVETLLARINTLDPQLHAFVHLEPDNALQQARQADKLTQTGVSSGPLHGIPFALKDIIDVEGMPTTAHSKILAHNIATHDAEVTRRLKAAGGIIIGKLATHEFAYGGPCFDLPRPPARNPWDLRMFPGGSSSGSGAAIAAGLIPVALGTDTGGSVRNPASMCGIVGMKATYGRVSRRGVIPLSFSLDHVGPMTRTIAENAAILSIISGHDPLDPASSCKPVPDFLAAAKQGALGDIQGLRIGVIRHFYRDDMVAHPAVASGIESALGILAKLGAEVIEVSTLALQEFTDSQRVLLMSESYTIHREWLQTRPADYAKMTREKLLHGAFLSAADYVQSVRNRPRFIAAIDALFEQADILVTASSMDLQFPVDDAEAVARCYPRQARAPFNLSGHPAISVPIGFTKPDDDEPPLPLSMQLIGRHFDEETVFRVAACHEVAAGLRNIHPPLEA